MRNLSLTSPHMKGNDVTLLQKALKAKGWLQGAVDGEFGPDTARAVYRAKYWLGYRKPDNHAGALLYNYLTGKKLPLAMRLRTTNRSRVAKRKPLRLKMWEEAGKWIGVKEHPAGSNICRFSLWYGLIGPWCAMFVTWCATVAKSLSFNKRKSHYAYCPYIVADARAGHNNLAITYKPLTGNLALFDWDNDGIADHIELFGKWLNAERTRFSTRGGNTGHTNASNGGEVLPMERSKSDVICFVNVGK